MQDVEARLMQVSYHELVSEDGEQAVVTAPGEAVQPSFTAAVKNYRVRVGMSATFHCQVQGSPRPQVRPAYTRETQFENLF